jgi:hypothetical protein
MRPPRAWLARRGLLRTVLAATGYPGPFWSVMAGVAVVLVRTRWHGTRGSRCRSPSARPRRPGTRPLLTVSGRLPARVRCAHRLPARPSGRCLPDAMALPLLSPLRLSLLSLPALPRL